MRYICSTPTPILQILKELYPDSSGNTLKSFILQRRVFINDLEVKKINTLLQPGDVLTVGKKRKWIADAIELLYEDSELIVIDKPEGLLTVASETEKELTAHALLKQHYKTNRIFVVHRLDQGTSGVMLFAKSEVAFDKLKETFKDHDITRTYTVIVEGHLAEQKGTWRSYLWEDPGFVIHSTQDPNRGELAITHYMLINQTAHYSWVECRLETGKKNQIRVHCQVAGNPVVGDAKYGAQTDPLKRLCLHATTLQFSHPTTGKEMLFQVPVPPAFFRLVPRREDA